MALFKKKKFRFKKSDDMIDMRELQKRRGMIMPRKKLDVSRDNLDKHGFLDLHASKNIKKEDNNVQEQVQNTPQKEQAGFANFFGFMDNASSNQTQHESRGASGINNDNIYTKRQVDEKIEQLDNKIYKIEQRLELIERKLDIGNNSGSIW